MSTKKACKNIAGTTSETQGPYVVLIGHQYDLFRNPLAFRDFNRKINLTLNVTRWEFKKVLHCEHFLYLIVSAWVYTCNTKNENSTKHEIFFIRAIFTQIFKFYKNK